MRLVYTYFGLGDKGAHSPLPLLLSAAVSHGDARRATLRTVPLAAVSGAVTVAALDEWHVVDMVATTPVS